jgi:hypothetical protein
MSKRISVVLPESILQALDGVSKRGGKQGLCEQLKAGYEANAKENLEIALDWFPADEEAWQASPQGSKLRNSKRFSMPGS